MKKYAIGFIVGAIVFGSIGAYALTVASKDVTYNDTNVESAINDLYSRVNANASDYSKDWFPEGIPLLPPLDETNYTNYITVESYSTANLHNGNEIWGPFDNKNVTQYYAAAQSGIDYVVKLKTPVYADKLMCQAGGWTGGYSNYTVYYLDKNNNWKQIYTSGNTSDYSVRTITINDMVYGLKLSGYHYHPTYNTYYPFAIQRLQLVRNWQ